MLLERKGRKKIGEGTWAISYVDMLTLLLCFFIIFYNSEQVKGTVEVTPLQRIIYDLSSKIKKMGGPGEGAGPVAASAGSAVTGVGVGPKAGAPDAARRAEQERQSILELLTKNMRTGSARIRVVGQAIEVSFVGLSFFDTGARRLNREGDDAVADLIRVLEPHKESVRIIVQGHTDTRKIQRREKNMTDNWELSVLRATSVLKRFLAAGFPSRSLSAEGFADTQVARDEAAALAHQRRITLRIEAKEGG